eukprot:800318-Rhodomonas_salina.1
MDRWGSSGWLLAELAAAAAAVGNASLPTGLALVVTEVLAQLPRCSAPETPKAGEAGDGESDEEEERTPDCCWTRVWSFPRLVLAAVHRRRDVRRCFLQPALTHSNAC